MRLWTYRRIEILKTDRSRHPRWMFYWSAVAPSVAGSLREACAIRRIVGLVRSPLLLQRNGTLLVPRVRNKPSMAWSDRI